MLITDVVEDATMSLRTRALVVDSYAPSALADFHSVLTGNKIPVFRMFRPLNLDGRRIGDVNK